MASPSDARRQALKAADVANQLRVLDSLPVSKYMDIAEQLLDRFQDAVDQRHLDEAYVYGLRFANLVVGSLPQHQGWKRKQGCSAVDARQKKRLEQQADKLLSMMEVIKQRMDAEELAKEKARHIARQEAEENEMKRQNSQRRREQEQRIALEKERQQYLSQQKRKKEEEKKNDIEQTKQNVEQSAMAKLLALNAKMAGSKDSTIVNNTAQPSKKKNAVEASEMSSVPPKVNLKKSSKPTLPGKTAKKQTTSQKQHKPQMPSNQNVQLHSKLCANQEEIQQPPSKAAKKSVPPRPKPTKTKSTKTDSSSNAVTETAAQTSSAGRKTQNRSRSIQRMPEVELLKSQEKTVVTEKRPHEIETELEEPQSIEPNLPSRFDSRPEILSPTSSKEQRTINLLQQSIVAQEQRLGDIENRQIPALLASAKSFLREKNKPEALKCVAHKKRLEQQVDVIKAAVFNMETQIFMLENAMEDRHVKRALDEAASAISGLQASVGDPNAARLDLTDMNDALASIHGVEETDDELMEELEVWLSPDEKRKVTINGEEDISILSLPSVPSSQPLPQGSVGTILQAVLGS